MMFPLGVPMHYVRHPECRRNHPEHRKHEFETQHSAVSQLTPFGADVQLPALCNWYAAYAKTRKLRRVLLLTSPFLRTTILAQSIRKALKRCDVAVTFLTNNQLQEVELGHPRFTRNWVDPDWKEAERLAKLCDSHQYVPPPGGESLAAAANRQQTALNSLALYLRESPDTFDLVIVVGHGLTGRLLIMEATNQSWEWFRKQKDFPHASPRLIKKGKDKGYLFTSPQPNHTGKEA